MSKFPKDFGTDVEVEEVDLDAADVRYRGNELTEARAEKVAADIVSRTPGRPASRARGRSDRRLSRSRSPYDRRGSRSRPPLPARSRVILCRRLPEG